MKRRVAYSFLCCLLALNLSSVQIEAKLKDRSEVSLAKCVDGDTAHFLIKGNTIKARFLAIDAPEISGTVEAFGNEASEYACRRMKEANVLEIAYDTKSNKQDKYGRDLVWVYVDNKLLQEELIEQGFAKVAYIYGDYEYVSHLEEVQQSAQSSNLGIWGDYDNKLDVLTIVEVAAIILLLFTGINKRTRNKLVKRLKKIKSNR